MRSVLRATFRAADASDAQKSRRIAIPQNIRQSSPLTPSTPQRGKARGIVRSTQCVSAIASSTSIHPTTRQITPAPSITHAHTRIAKTPSAIAG